MDVLFVCTANICRSPTAEALLRHKAEASGIDLHVHSAGLLEGGRAATPDGIDLLARRGIDNSGHLSRTMSAELLTGADLVLTMSREHLREAVVLAPSCWPRAFTLKEIVRRAHTVGRRGPDESLDGWLARVAGGRTHTELLGFGEEDDVADPMGQGTRAYEVMLAEIDELLDRLITLVWGRAAVAEAP